MSKVVIFGAGGQLGRELSQLYPEATTVFHSINESSKSVDLSDHSSLSEFIRKEDPKVVINAAAIANVDLCEKDHALAHSVNGEAPGVMARTCNDIGAKFIHVSTDYVFDGSDGDYSEKAVPNPINYYGLSKLVGDVHCLSYDDSLIVRTSGVFGHNMNFPRFVLESLKKGKEINAISGFYSPIHAANLAAAISELAEKQAVGLINVAGERISRYDLAVSIARTFSLDSSLVQRVDAVASMNAKRPFDSSLNCSKALSILRTPFNSTKSNLAMLEGTEK